jgi:heme-degrading monooxygenase HmoA
VRKQVIPGIEARCIPGFSSIDLIRREREHDVEFMTLMWFDSPDSVKPFMGEDYEAAHVPQPPAIDGAEHPARRDQAER